MKGLGYGAGYLYPHDYEEAVVEQDYLPERLRGRRYYEPSDRGRGTARGGRSRAFERGALGFGLAMLIALPGKYTL